MATEFKLSYTGREVNDKLGKIDGLIEADGRLTNELAVERARINNFTALQDGSTTGDAELQDIRVGYNGDIHENAGDAVRNQYGALKNELNHVMEDSYILDPCWRGSEYPNRILNGSGGSVASSDYSIKRFEIKKGDFIYVDLSPDTEHLWQFNAGTSPKAANLRGTVHNESRGFFAIPDGANYVLVSTLNDNTTNEVYECDPKSDTITQKISVEASNCNEILPDMDYAKINCVYALNNCLQNISHIPNTDELSAIVLTFNGELQRETNTNKSFTLQILVDSANTLFYRSCWGGVWTDWMNLKESKETSAFVPNYVELSAFNKLGIIGDSMSVGAHRGSDGITSYGRDTKSSWGQYISDKYNVETQWFGFSSATTETFISRNTTVTDESGRTDKIGLTNVLDEANKCDAYIIGLGYNDSGSVSLGTLADVAENADNNANSYYGNMDKIIRKIMTAYPNAHLFILTNPRMNRDTASDYNNAIKDIVSNITPEVNDATKLHLIDLYEEYSEVYASWDSYMWYAHYTRNIYYRMGELIGTSISNYMREYPNTFRFVNE